MGLDWMEESSPIRSWNMHGCFGTDGMKTHFEA